MGSLLSRAALARILPFVLFMVLLAVRGHWPVAWAAWLDPRWLYGVSCVLVTASLVYFRRDYTEMARPTGLTWKNALLAVVVGVVVFELWIRLAEPWMMLEAPTATFKPVTAEGELDIGLVIVRWMGASLLVPVMEELFWRSFLMRWVDKPEFEQIDPGQVSPKAIVLSTVVFMLAHTQWLAAIVAGLAYAGLYRYTRSLWVPIIAHGVTNGVLGVWVVFYGNWQFW